MGDLDYLIIDLPPGTGECAVDADPDGCGDRRRIGDHAVYRGARGCRKAIEMFRQVNVEVLGVVENMSTFACPHCGKAWTFLATVKLEDCDCLRVPVLGEVEIDPRIRSAQPARRSPATSASRATIARATL